MNPPPPQAQAQPTAQLSPYRCPGCLTLIPTGRFWTRCGPCAGRVESGRAPRSTNPALREIGQCLRSPEADQPALRLLLQALSVARYYVHFLSYGLSPEFIGALNMTAMRVPVSGVISNADAALCAAMSSASAQAPLFDTRCFPTPTTWTASPHERLIVIDGVLALSGPVSLTTHSWRDHSLHNRGGLRVEMDPRRVSKLNNQHVVPLWAGRQGKASSALPSLNSAA